MPSHAATVLILLALLVQSSGQKPAPPAIPPLPPIDNPDEVRLPNGKKQIDELLKSDRDKSIEDVKQLIAAAELLQKDLEQKDSQQLLNLNDIHRTEEIEKLAKRIRGRMRHN